MDKIILLSLLAVASLSSQGNVVSAFSFPTKKATTPTTSRSPSASPLFTSHFNNRKVASNAAILTYLEINGWLVTTSGVTLLIDPILEGALDFGVPSLYRASKRSLPATGLSESLPPIDCVLLTQGLDDHAHVRTLTAFAERDIAVPIVAPPSARGALEKSGFLSASDANNNIRFVRPGEEFVISPRFRNSDTNDPSGGGIRARATSGALVGPPWQARENGYVLRPSDGPSIYIEPHVEFSVEELMREAPVDVAITPISGEGLPAFELVHGPSDTLKLLETLRPKTLLPMQNGDVDTEGVGSKLVKKIGSAEEFRRRLESAQKRWSKDLKVIDVVPGEDIRIAM